MPRIRTPPCAAGHLKDFTTRVAHVLPVSDDGGSTAEIVRVLGGPAVGDIRSRCLRLADDSDGEVRGLLRGPLLACRPDLDARAVDNSRCGTEMRILCCQTESGCPILCFKKDQVYPIGFSDASRGLCCKNCAGAVQAPSSLRSQWSKTGFLAKQWSLTMSITCCAHADPPAC
jgi:2-phospho-L-lactate transferase CofD